MQRHFFVSLSKKRDVIWSNYAARTVLLTLLFCPPEYFAFRPISSFPSRNVSSEKEEERKKTTNLCPFSRTIDRSLLFFFSRALNCGGENESCDKRRGRKNEDNFLSRRICVIYFFLPYIRDIITVLLVATPALPFIPQRVCAHSERLL